MHKLPKNEGLNVVPFIDIMLVLLAIVLSISTFIAQGAIEVKLPASDNAASINKQDKKMIISIDAQNNFFVDGQGVDLVALREKIMGVDEQTLIELKSDRAAHFESFVEIIDLLKEKKHENFQIITEVKK